MRGHMLHVQLSRDPEPRDTDPRRGPQRRYVRVLAIAAFAVGLTFAEAPATATGTEAAPTRSAAKAQAQVKPADKPRVSPYVTFRRQHEAAEQAERTRPAHHTGRPDGQSATRRLPQ